jgi:hypothetical protein
MKRCPACNRTYSDEAMTFCLADGSLLSAPYDSPDTLRIPASRNTAPTEVLPVEKPEITQLPLTGIAHTPSTYTPAPGVKPGKSSIIIIIAIGASAILGALGMWAWLERSNQSSTDLAAVPAGNSNSTVTNRNISPSSATVTQGSESPSTALDISASRSEVKAALDGWLQTYTDRDFNNHMKYYASTLDTFYRKSNVSLAYVRSVNQDLFEKYSVMNMSISNLRIDVNPASERVVTTFDKTFDFRGDNTFHSGSVQSEFHWEKINGAWRITSERDLQIYYVNKQ